MGEHCITIMAPADLVICEHCDSVYQRVPLQPRQIARCACCGGELYRARRFNLDTMLALTLASAVVFVIANSFPIAELETQGRSSESSLWGAILATFDAGVAPIALIAALSVFFFPLLQICLFAYVLVPLRLGRVPRAFTGAMHALRQMQPWAMVEVFMIGVLVAVVKLSAMAEVRPLTGMWGFVGLAVLLTALNAFNLRDLWNRAGALAR